MSDGEDLPGAGQRDAIAVPPGASHGARQLRQFARSGHGGRRPHIRPPSRAALPPPLPNAPPAEADAADMLPPPGLAGQDRARRIAVLRGLVQRRLQRSEEEGTQGASWCLGAAAVDRWLGAAGLDTGGVHGMKPESASAEDRAAAVLFALALARRRVDAWSIGRQAPEASVPSILWCEPRYDAAEIGGLYAPGLARLGFAARQFVIVATRRPDDTLWAAEEGLRSGALALVVAMVAETALTPARRLALAAEHCGTPCLLLSAPHAAAAATATRWRVARAPAAPHPFDIHAPGAPRLAVTLERCRGRPLVAARSFVLEWSHASARFDLVTGFCDAAVAADGAAVGEVGRDGMARIARRSSGGRP